MHAAKQYKSYLHSTYAPQSMLLLHTAYFDVDAYLVCTWAGLTMERRGKACSLMRAVSEPSDGPAGSSSISCVRSSFPR